LQQFELKSVFFYDAKITANARNGYAKFTNGLLCMGHNAGTLLEIHDEKGQHCRAADFFIDNME